MVSSNCSIVENPPTEWGADKGGLRHRQREEWIRRVHGRPAFRFYRVYRASRIEGNASVKLYNQLCAGRHEG